MRYFLSTLLVVFLVYSLSGYGGVRSPDGEIQYRSAEALAFRGEWAITEDLWAWPGFGLSTGIDGKRYSIFGPFGPILLSSWIRLSEPIARHLSSSSTVVLPASHYVGNINQNLKGIAPASLRLQHARRFVASFFEAFLAALAVAVFFLFARDLTGSTPAGIFSAMMLGFATPLWSYSGTFFGEPLALLCMVLALWCILKELYLVAGVMAGLAAAAHISALLWAPFFAMILSFRCRGIRECFDRSYIPKFLKFSLGLVGPLAALAYFNYRRFGSFFETGRQLGTQAARHYGYGELILPDSSLLGLLVSPGKGLLVLVPLVLVALFFWQRFYREVPWAATVLLAGVLFRLLFIACRSDWHGGFCLGPRYLLLVLPVALIPLAFLLRDEVRLRGSIAALCAAAIFQQAIFVSIEIFAMYHSLILEFDGRGIDLFENERLYWGWEFSPLAQGWRFPVSPWIMKLLGIGVLGSAGLLAVSVYAAWLLLGRPARVGNN